MTDLIVYKLGASPLDAVAWGAFDGGTIGDAGRVADVAALAGVKDRFPPETRAVAVLQGEQVAMRAIPNPPKQAAKMRAAAAFLLEDDLAQAIDDAHIIVAQQKAYAISKALLRNWLAAFDEANVPVAEATVDYACVGASGTACILVGDKERIIAARGDAGFAAEIALADAVAPSFIKGAGDAAIVAYGAHDLVGKWADVPVERRPLPHEADVVALYGAHLSTRNGAPNFLTGEFRRKSAQTFRLGMWRRPAALAAGLAVAAVVSAAAAGVRDARIASAYETQAQTLHQSAFPTYAGSDIREHARGIVAGGGKSASFLDLSGRLTASLEGHDGVVIDRVRYDAARDIFTFSIRSNSDAGIEAFRGSLNEHGLVAEDSGGYRRSGEAWIGEMSARPR